MVILSNSGTSGNSSRDDIRPPTLTEMRDAKERWDREHGLTPAILRVYTLRVQQTLWKRRRCNMSDELIVALLWHIEQVQPEAFFDAVAYAQSLVKGR